MRKERERERVYISSPAVSSPSQRWKVSRASSHNTPLPFHFSPAFIPAAPQRSLTIVIMTNQYRLSTDPPPPPHPSSAALEFLNTDPADSPVKVSSQGLHFIVYPTLSTIPPSVFSISPVCPLSLLSRPMFLSTYQF